MRKWNGRHPFTVALASVAIFFAGLLLCGPSYARQAEEPRRIGVLVVSFSPESREAQAFRAGLADAGYVEGRDVVIEWRFTKGDYELVPEMAEDLVQSNVDVIVADTTVAAQGVKQATSTIPVVMAFVADPIAAGLVTSLARPGGNVTGLSMMIPELSTKRLQLLKEINPELSRVAVVWNPDSPFHAQVIEQLKSGSSSLGIELSFVKVQTPEDVNQAVAAATEEHAQALFVIEEPLVYTNRMKFIKQVSNARIPAIYPVRRFVEDGGLISYGTDFADLFRRSAGYVDKILNGIEPANLPVEQPVKFDCVVNLRTAKALGVTIPQSVLLQTNKIIQ